MDGVIQDIINAILPVLTSGEVPSWAMKFLAVIGAMRLFFKPVMSLINTYIIFTPKTSDDDWWAKTQSSKAFKAFAYVLDWFGSIKVKTK